MNTVVLEVRSLKETLADAARAMKSGRAEREARISFATPELLWEVLRPRSAGSFSRSFAAPGRCLSVKLRVGSDVT